jgi:hypothetical protein
MNILRIPETRFSDDDIRQSLENEKEINRLQMEWPEIQRRYAELGEETAKAADHLEGLKKRRASIAEIQKAEKEYKQAIWKQDGVKADHGRKVADLQSRQERLSAPLRNDAHQRWLDELRGLAYLRHIETVKEDRNIFTGEKTQDILTNLPALGMAKEMLLTAIQRLMAMQNATIPSIQAFIETFEAELAEVDLSKLTQWDDVPISRVNDVREKPADGPIDKATMMPDGKVHVHPQPTDPKVKALGDRISKLEKGSMQ